jgi:hypothetical protein
LLASAVSALFASGDPIRASEILHTLAEDASSDPGEWYDTAEVIRLCYWTARDVAQDGQERVRLTALLRRSSGIAAHGKALAIAATVDGLVDAGDIGNAVEVVDEIIPLFEIPVGSQSFAPDRLGPACDFGRSCYTASCNRVAIALAHQGLVKQALGWVRRGAAVAFVRDEECILHDERESSMRTLIDAWWKSGDAGYMRAAADLAQELWPKDLQFRAGWTAIVALAGAEDGGRAFSLGLLRQGAREAELDEMGVYDRTIALLTFADAFSMLGAHAECEQLLQRCVAIARRHQTIQDQRENAGVLADDEPETLLPAVAASMAWRAERLGQCELMEHAARLMLEDARADPYWHQAALGVRVAVFAAQRKNLALFDLAIALGEGSAHMVMPGFGIARPLLEEIMFCGGLSGDDQIIRRCESYADNERDALKRARLYAYLARGIAEATAPGKWQKWDVELPEHARAWLELWEPRWKHGWLEFMVPPESG